jgi:hypothetical protein
MMVVVNEEADSGYALFVRYDIKLKLTGRDRDIFGAHFA